MDRKELTYQQKLVWDRLMAAREKLEASNHRIDVKASKIVAGSSAAVTAIAGVNMLPDSLEQTSPLSATLLFVLCLTMVLMFCLVTKFWGPRDAGADMTTDVDRLQSRYVDAPIDEAFKRAIKNVASLVDDLMEENSKRSQELGRMVTLLQVQAGILALLVAAKICEW